MKAAQNIKTQTHHSIRTRYAVYVINVTTPLISRNQSRGAKISELLEVSQITYSHSALAQIARH